MNRYSYSEKKQILYSYVIWLVLAGLQQRLFAFQPMPRTSIIERKIQDTGFRTTPPMQRRLTAKENRLGTDEINPTPAIDRRSIIKATTSAFLFTFPFTRGQEASNAAPGLVQFPCEGRLMNTYHFMRSGESLLECEDLISTNPLSLTNREDALSPLGVEQVQDACRDMMARGINPSVVKYSLAAKSMDSANVVASEMKIGRDRLVPEYTFMDPRGIGRWDMQRLSTTEEAVWALDHAKSGKDGRGGLPPSHDDGTPNETLSNQVTRLRELLSLLETHCSGDTILLVFPDGTGPALLSALIGGIPLNRVHELNFEPGEIRYDITYNRVLHDMPSDPLPSYTAAIKRGSTTLEQYESNPNQFLDLREEERFTEEKLRRELKQKEIDLREKEILAQKEELRRKILVQEDLQKELARKKTLAKSANREKTSTESIEAGINKTHKKDSVETGGIIEAGGNISHRKERLVVDERKTPGKLKKITEAETMPNHNKIIDSKSKDKKIAADKKILDNRAALDHNKKSETTAGSTPDSPVLALAIAGVMAAFKFAAGSTEGESDKDVDYYSHLEQTRTAQDATEAIDQNSIIAPDLHKSTSITTAVIVSPDIPELSGDIIIQHLENATTSTVVSNMNTADRAQVENSTFATSPELQRMESLVALAPFDVPELTDLSEAEVRNVLKMKNITTTVAASIDNLDYQQPSSYSSGDRAKVDNSTFAISPELQRMENLVVSATFDVPELTDLSEVEVPKSEAADRIDNANKAMEEYLSQDDGGSDWLGLMSELMDSE